MSAIFSPNPQGQLATALEPALGAALAAGVALAWAPCLADSAECHTTASAEEFVRDQQALLSYQTSFTEAVDETIRILQAAPDQSWRKKMVVEFHSGGGLPDYLLMADGANFLECFSIPHLVLPVGSVVEKFDEDRQELIRRSLLHECDEWLARARRSGGDRMCRQ